jgi:hypothetical protein
MLKRERRQHQAYALQCVNAAVDRLILARTPAEKAKAGQWARRWTKAAGNSYSLYFRVVNAVSRRG